MINKFNLGDEVFYVTHQNYAYDYSSDSDIYKDARDEIGDYIVLYGKIEEITIKSTSIEYEITVGYYKGLKYNNLAVEYRDRHEEQYSNIVLESEIFSLDELDKAKTYAKQKQKEYKKQIKLEKERDLLEQRKDNANCLYDFLLRECEEFNVKYSKDDIIAMAKLGNSPRVALYDCSFTYDLLHGVEVQYDASETYLLEKEPEYIKMLKDCLGVSGYTKAGVEQ